MYVIEKFNVKIVILLKKKSEKNQYEDSYSERKRIYVRACVKIPESYDNKTEKISKLYKTLY